MISLYRTYCENYTIGRLVLPDASEILILERPWLDNKQGVSCVPEGQYIVEPDTTGRFRYYELQNVPNRTEIEIHPANKASELMGCLAPVSAFNSKIEFGSSSRKACDRLFESIGHVSWVIDIKGDKGQ